MARPGGGDAAPAPGPVQVSNPIDIAAGPDGNLWFTQYGRIGRITTSGVITEFRAGAEKDYLYGIAAGPDGAMWFTELLGGRIGRITPEGEVRHFPTGIDETFITGIAPAPDGSMWFTAGFWETPGSVRRITTAGAVTRVATPSTPGSAPFGISSGPDGAMWFTDTEGPSIGRVAATGTREWTDPALETPRGIAAGPDGAMWFADGGGTVGRITRSGRVTVFPAGADTTDDIAPGPDGSLWFTASRDDGGEAAIGRVTTSGAVTVFRAGLSRDAGPNAIVAGPDGAMWFTEAFGNRIGRITMAGVVTEFPVTARFLSGHQVGAHTVVARLRCPVTAADVCRGSLRLGRTGAGGERPMPTLAPGRSTTVAIPISRAWRRLVASRGSLAAKVWLLPVRGSRAGELAQPVTLRPPPPSPTPPVTG